MGARWDTVLWWREYDPEHGLRVYFIGVGYLKLKEFCRLREMMQAKAVLFPSYLNDKYVFCKSYSCIQLKLAIIYFILNLPLFWLMSPTAWEALQMQAVKCGFAKHSTIALTPAFTVLHTCIRVALTYKISSEVLGQYICYYVMIRENPKHFLKGLCQNTQLIVYYVNFWQVSSLMCSVTTLYNNKQSEHIKLYLIIILISIFLIIKRDEHLLLCL